MSRAIYLTAMGPASGKSLVALGLVELVSQRVSRVGFFRPIVQSLPDNDLELVRARYRLPDERIGYAFIAEHLRSLLSASRDEADAGMAQAVAVYKQLEEACDLVVIEGTDFTGPSAHLEFGFNARVARHLGAPVVAVVNGHDRSVDDIMEAVRVSEESLVGQGDSLIALIVNRVPPKRARRARRPPRRRAGDHGPRVGAARGRRLALPHPGRARRRPRRRVDGR